MKQLFWLALLWAGLALAQGPSTITVALPPTATINDLFPILPAQDYTESNLLALVLIDKPLLWIGRGIQVDYARSIASSITTPDGEHYTITLNPKWHWSDGAPVTARDVAFELALLRSIPASQASLYGGWGIGGIPNLIRSVRVLGTYRLEVTYDHPYNPQWVILNGLSQIVPLPAHAWDRYPNDPAKTLAYLQDHGDDVQFFAHAPIDGPFRIVASVLNHHFTFVANPAYDGHKPTYQTLVFKYFTTSDAEYNALATGEVQIGYIPFHLLHTLPPGDHILSQPTWAITYIWLNFARPTPLRSLIVRQALERAIDQPAMVQEFFHHQAVPQYGPVPAEPSTYLSPALQKNPYPYDPLQGKALLEAHGWHLINGVMERNGTRLEFTLHYASGSVSTSDIAQAFAEAAAQEGIVIHLKPQPLSVIQGLLAEPKAWSMVISEWTYLPDVYPTGFGLFGSQGGSNLGAYSNPQANQLIAMTHAFYTTPSQALQALWAYQDFIAHQLPFLWLPQPDGGPLGAPVAYSTALHGIISHVGPIYLSPQYWSYR